MVVLRSEPKLPRLEYPRGWFGTHPQVQREAAFSTSHSGPWRVERETRKSFRHFPRLRGKGFLVLFVRSVNFVGVGTYTDRDPPATSPPMPRRKPSAEYPTFVSLSVCPSTTLRNAVKSRLKNLATVPRSSELRVQADCRCRCFPRNVNSPLDSGCACRRD